MALTQTQVSQLYVTLFGRASEGSGNTYWQNSQSDVAVAAQAMLDTAAAKTYFGTSMDSNEAFIKHIYKNTLNKTEADDAAGIKFWVDALNAGNSRGFVVSELLKAAVDPKNAGDAQNLFNNKVEVSNYTANKVANVASASATDLAPFVEAINKVTATSTTEAKAFVDTIKSAAADTSTPWVSTPVNPGETFTLTNHTDKATANVFEAPMVYNPGGTDRILSLQDEDVLTGTAGRADNTLNAELGMQNADEGTGDARTPYLNNIQYVNAKILGDVNKLDLRYADGLKKVNIDQISLNAKNHIKVLNIKTSLEGMRVANDAKQDANVQFQFKEGVLAGTEDKGLLELNDVIAQDVIINSDSASPEGYEKLDLTAKNGVNIDSLQVNQMKELLVKGSGNLTVANLKANDGSYLDEFTKVDAGGIQAPGSTGLTLLDASGFNGKLTLDVTKVINPSTNPFGSGVDIPVNIIGSGKDDVFYSNEAPGKNTKLNGGEGSDKLVMISKDISAPKKGDALSITGIETLELRMQGKDPAVGPDWIKGTQKANFDAFKDDALRTVVVRDESQSKGVAKFTLENVTNTFAKDGKVVIEHSVTTGNVNPSTGERTTGDVNKDVYLEVLLKDASGKDDSVTVEVKNANNTQKVFNYQIDADAYDVKSTSENERTKQAVENITVIDSDTESNVVTFVPTHEVITDKGIVNESDHTGTVTLKGGKAGQTYTVDSIIFAKTLDASEQLSDLRLRVQDQFQDIGQAIKLGSGDDILTFEQIDGFDAKDVVSDKGGRDIVRAAFSKDSALNLAGIEELHVVATKNVNLNMAKADVEKVVVLSDKAVDGTSEAPNKIDNSKGSSEPFNIKNAEIKASTIITFENSKLSELNFFGDLDNDDDPADTDDDSTDQIFNGVTLKNNVGENLAVNINSSRDVVKKGATSYTVGQLTVHGSKNITINVSDERKDDPDTAADEKTVTEIKNIYGKDINTVVANATGHLNLGTVTADAQNRGISLVDATKVGGDFKATVIALGDAAQVKLADGNNVFSALGSAGKLINIKAGNGNNTITGSAQSDIITTGNGNNTVHGDRGDNVITVGNGDDTITAKDGNDTVVFGEGYDTYVDNKNTSIDATKATTAVTKEFGAANVQIDVNGDDTIDVDQWLAVGKGSELKFQWEGTAPKIDQIVLDGAKTLGQDVSKANANANLWTFGAGEHNDINAKEGNDVAIAVDAGAALGFDGGEGNDAAVGGNKTDVFKGGLGSDVLVMQKTKISWNDADTDGKIQANEFSGYDGNSDTVKIADGESVAGSHDVLYGFDATTTTAATKKDAAVASGVAGRDILQLSKGFSQANSEADVVNGTKAVDGEDVGKFIGHYIDAKNFVNFASDKVTAGAHSNLVASGEAYKKDTAGVAANASTKKHDFVAKDDLQDALSYLAKHFDNSKQTVAFAYDRDGNGVYEAEKDSVFLFQDGAKDTVVELVGGAYNGVGDATTTVAGTIAITE